MKKKYSQILALLLTAFITLGIHNGNVALWKGEDPQPHTVFSVPVDTLPNNIRRQLEKGITITSEHQLHSFLESLLS